MSLNEGAEYNNQSYTKTTKKLCLQTDGEVENNPVECVNSVLSHCLKGSEGQLCEQQCH